MPTWKRPDKRLLAKIGVSHVLAMIWTWRDLRNRPDEQVRGDKRIWRVASAVNIVGSAAYWIFGRRRRPGETPVGAEPASRTAEM